MSSVEVGREYKDARGRRLTVSAADALKDRIEGLLADGREYSCNYAIFREVWLQRRPPVPPAQQEANRRRMGV